MPGTAKAPEALREAGLFDRLASMGARDGGVVLPGRYIDDDETRDPAHVRNQEQLVDHTRRLAQRIGDVWSTGDTPVVIGGDCSVLLAAGLASARRGGTGLVHIDGHTDFRHPGNSDECASVAGEDLAAVVGLHRPAIADIDGRAPYFEPTRAAHLGHRDDDEHVDEARTVLGCAVSASRLASGGAAAAAAAALETAGESYWVQVDVDVLDPSVMPAVDSPDPGGIGADQLTELIGVLAPRAAGISVTVFDPDLDPDGACARILVDIIANGLAAAVS
ncbi:arginase family protein [Microbacterium oleivorans]|uniref:arginase family protein n=1 Tax=Microbacterium oleivorans TaxID=273677 RepID=UPI002116ADE7|nr:arginase family protein [Microbacterium oleivorans]